MDLLNVNVSPDKSFSDVTKGANKKMQESLGNPIIMFIFFLVLIVFINLFNSSKMVNRESVPQTMSMKILETLLWGLFIFLVLINGLQYFFSIDIKTAVRNLFTKNPEVDINITQKDLATLNDKQPEVFHINENTYTYGDAKAACKAQDAELASYNQIENAYRKGAEWCSYGWSKGQMALFPTSKKTWKKLQSTPGNENSCGRPGINGGYIANPNAKFGVNCFGIKRNPTDLETKSMNIGNPFPKSKEEERMQSRINYYRKHKNNILLAPFNKDTWSSV
tara:strand:- start:264 stop:1100 length:837 start_codon:yes stop_codon:yes gene_type:complete